MLDLTKCFQILHFLDFSECICTKQWVKYLNVFIKLDSHVRPWHLWRLHGMWWFQGQDMLRAKTLNGWTHAYKKRNHAGRWYLPVGKWNAQKIETSLLNLFVNKPLNYRFTKGLSFVSKCIYNHNGGSGHLPPTEILA